MNRAIKNIICILLIVIVGVGIYFTCVFAKNNIEATSEVSSQSNMGTPPDMNNNSGNNSSSSSDEDETTTNATQTTNDDSNKPSMPGNSSNGEPPEKPSGDNSNSQTPPEKPSDDNNSDSSSDSSSNSNMQTPPDMPNGNSSSDSSSSDSNSSGSNSNQMPSMPGNMEQTSSNSTQELTTVYYVIFAVEALVLAIIVTYLVMSIFNKKTFKETFATSDKVIIGVLATILLTLGFTYSEVTLANNLFLNTEETQSSESNNSNGGGNASTSENTESANYSGSVEVDGKEQTITQDISTSTSDENAVIVKNGGNATIENITITKSGEGSNTENSEFYGANSAVLVTANSTATIKNASISTSDSLSNVLFATGENAKLYVSNSTITSTGSRSARGLDATYGGYIEADSVKVTTQGGSCASLATDRGEGTVIANNSTLETNGTGSPVIYSTGDISIDNTTGVANNSQMVVIEGKNSATVTNSTLKASGKGNRGSDSELVDSAGIMIYQSMSGDASEGTGTFTAKDSTLEIDSSSDYYSSAPFFFVTNTDAVINLENTTLVYGSKKLLSIKGTDEWGKSGSNGGNVTFNATNQKLVGEIEVDNISTLSLNLEDGSTFKGIINQDNTAKSITLKLSSDSKIKLYADSYVTELDDEDTSYSNIDFNGYTLYVNGTAIN